MESYVCAACGGVVALARRAAHDAHWCSAGSDDSEGEGDDEAAAERPPAASSAAARASLSPLCASVVTVEVPAHLIIGFLRCCPAPPRRLFLPFTKYNLVIN